MAEKELVIKEKVENTGLFDFPALYKFAYTWLKDENYLVDEDKYSEKVSGSSRDVTVEWTVRKNVSDYFKIEMKIKFFIEKLTDVEVEIDGTKKKMNKGKAEVEIKSSLVTDRESKWDKTSMYRFWRDVYDKYVIPGRVDQMREKTAEDTIKFKEEIKRFFDVLGRRYIVFVNT